VSRRDEHDLLEAQLTLVAFGGSLCSQNPAELKAFTLDSKLSPAERCERILRCVGAPAEAFPHPVFPAISVGSKTAFLCTALPQRSSCPWHEERSLSLVNKEPFLLCVPYDTLPPTGRGREARSSLSGG
jgi:hypothetical protein